MVAFGSVAIEEDAMQAGRAGKVDIAFLRQFPRQGLQQGLARFHPTARQMPAAYIAMLNEQDAARAVDHQAAHAERHSPCETPIGMQKPPDQGFPHGSGNALGWSGFFHRAL
jgi:hypothetical protein